MPSNIIGTGPNQVPTNADLGTMAFQDAALYQNINQSQTGFKNRIINGDMRIDQRNAGASVTPADGQYLVDRWKISASQASKLTAQQNSGGLEPVDKGFTKYQGIVSSSAYSVVATDIFAFQQSIEGLNVSDLAWGSASASPVTLSFWVRSSLTGIFGGSIANDGVSRSYPYTYTINTANTWEYKTVTIPGDTTGTWVKDNGTGMRLYFGLGVGSTYSGTAGSWAAAGYRSATGATSVVGTNGATFYITGVQLEKGSTATSFDYRPYGTELALCQRYFQKVGYGWAGRATGSAGEGTVLFPVEMRATPTLAHSGVANNVVQPGISYYTTTGISGTLTMNNTGSCFGLSGISASGGSIVISSGQLATASAEL